MESIKVTIYSNGEVFIPDRLIGFVGEDEYRQIEFEYPTIAGAENYKMRIEYDDGLIYEVPITNRFAEIGGSILREAGKKKAQFVAYAYDDTTAAYTMVMKSKIFEVIIGEAIGDDVAPIPSYEAIMSAVTELVETGMTREQVITAIDQIISTGEVQDLDTGFVTTLKEINNGVGFRVWLGTNAEYSALTDKESNVLYVRSDDNSYNLPEVTATKPLADIFGEYGNGITVYTIRSCDTSIYPMEVSAGSAASAYATVTLIARNGAGMFHFEYGDNVYVSYVCYAGNSVSVGNWINLTRNDSGWETLTISGTGFSAHETTPPQYRKIDNHVFLRGKLVVDMDTVSDLTTVFATLPSGYRPSMEKYQLLAGEGDRMARLYIRTGGGININYFKEYAGAAVTGSHWLQIDTDFLTN